MPAYRRHRRRVRRSGNPGYEARLNEALESLGSGEFPSLRQAANARGIPKSTLCDRAKGRHTSWKQASHARQNLTPDEEQALLDWCRQRAQESRPWSSQELRGYAQAISGQKIGRKWHLKFERRHPEIRNVRPAKLDPKRAKNFNKPTVDDFFDQYEGLHVDFDSIPQHLWNEDEKGIQMGGGRKNSGRKYYYFKDQKNRYRLGSDNLELVTVMECVSAAGDVMPPSFVLSDGPEPDLRHDLKEEDFGSLYTSPNGWSDDNHCKMWFQEVFIPNAKARMVDPEKPIVLIMDGHGSHETLQMERVAYDVLEKENIEIIIFCFPSKCTHKMQPLDVVIFNPVQKRWQGITDDCVLQRITIDRYNVIPLYVKGTREVMTKELIQKAFAKTGLYPVNRNVFTDEDFAPSQASSTFAHVPPTYPLDVPSSDPIQVEDSECDSDKDSSSDDMDYEPNHDQLGGIDDKSDCSSDIELNNPDDDHLQPTATLADDIIYLDDSDDDAKSTPTATADEPDSSEVQNGSGLMTALGRIEERFGLLTRSMVTDRLKPPPVVSLHEDMMLTEVELFSELRRVRQELLNTYSAYTRVTAALSGAEAHCTIIRREVNDLRTDLDKATKPRTRGRNKTKARFITSRDLHASFDERDAAEAERERVAAEKAKEKASNLAAERARISEDATSRIFSGRVRSYKGDLQALARALLLPEDGTADLLKSRIEEHLTGPEKARLEHNPRFLGLYPKPTQPRRRQAQISHGESSGVIDDLPPANNEAQLPSSSHGPSSHPVPFFPTLQHLYSQPIPPFLNPYAHFPAISNHMSYSHPYHYAPAHVHTAAGDSATPNTH